MRAAFSISMKEHYQLLHLLPSVYFMLLPFVKLLKFADNNPLLDTSQEEMNLPTSGKLTMWCPCAGKTTKKKNTWNKCSNDSEDDCGPRQLSMG